MPSHLQPIVYQIQSQCRTIISFFQEESSRYVLARLLATLLCASAATALWVYDENLADPFAFLTLTYRELAFPPGPSIGTYVETSTINIIAICISVIHCNIGKILAAFVARHYGHSSSRSRVVPACFLVSLAFGAGAVKSAYPRLAQACRMAGITAVFLLTSGVGEDRTLTSDWTSFLLISAIASLSSLISTACFLRRSSKAFTRLLILSFSHLRRHLGSKPTIHTSAELLEALNLPINTQLRRAYLQAFFEPRYSRLHVKDLRPFMKVVERLRAELSWGSVVPLHSRFSSFAGSYANFEGPTTAMTSALCDSLALLERTICLVFDMSLSPSTSEVSPPLSVFQYTEHLKQIHDAYRHLRHQLEVTHASADHSQAEGFPWSTEDATQDIFAISLYTISRLQVANDVSAALRLARTIYEKAGRNSRRRLWLPKPTHAWFSSSVSNSAWDSVDADFDEFARDASHYSLPPEHREEIIEAEESYHNKIVPPPSMQEKSSTRFRFYRHIWNRMKFAWSSMLTARLRWSRRLHSLKHSEHLHYAFKNAIGVSLLSLPAFLAPTSSGYKWFLEFHGQWIIVTYIFVLETNTGATIRTGGLRLIGTICGAVYAYLAWLISRHNSIALVALITLSDLPISWLILQTPVASIGVVAYVTIPPIIYPNLDRVQIKPTILLAVNRGSAIGLGIIAAVLMNHFVFPRHCRLIFLTQTSKTLRQLTELYISLTKHTIHAVSSASPDSRRNTKLENEIRDSLYRANTLIDMMHLEICILPKPLNTYRTTTRILQRWLDLLIGLRRVRENIPKETISKVLKYRKDLISCICVTLFACETSFRTGESLPQFLPSPQHALEALIREKNLAIANPGGAVADSPISRDVTSPDGNRNLAVSFSLAENALLEELVAILEDLLTVARRLNGTESWTTEELEEFGMAPTERLPIGRSGFGLEWEVIGNATPLHSPSASLSRWI